MNSNRWVGLAVLLLGMIALWGPASPGRAPAPQQQQAMTWEYKFVEPNPYPFDSFEKAFNDMGKDGWEYCETREMKRQDENKVVRNASVIIFKRPAKPAS